MRIIHLSYSSPKPVYKDPEAWLKRINSSVGVMESMTKYGEIIGIYHIQYKGIVEKNDVSYHFTGYNRWQLLFPFLFNRYVKKMFPDVIIAHGLISPWQVIMLRIQIGKRIKIITQHHAERPLKDIRQYFQKWADRFIQAYLFSSVDQGKEWVNSQQIQSIKKIKVVMGTSSPFYPIDRNLAQSNTGVQGSAVYLWVGGLNENKDPLTVALAFAMFTELNPDAKLYMVYQSGELIEALKETVNKMDASRNIFLVGRIDNPKLQDWYNSADFIISSSHYEGSGIAVCEALSCGCIPILTNIPSFRMMTAEGSIGLLFQAGQVESLLNALKKSLAINRGQEKMKVLNHFTNELSFDANARKIMEVIKEINAN
jgi:glycosyltransferase involved in cell wall biosynthesis